MTTKSATMDEFRDFLGDTAGADFLLSSPISQNGSTVIVSGTDGDDRFAFDAATLQLTVNGLRYDLRLTQAMSVVFDAGAGRDTVWLNGSDGDDTLTVSPGHATMTGPGFSLEASGFETVLAYATADGNDTAILHGTSGNDLLKTTPTYTTLHYTTLRGGGSIVRVKFFETTIADAGEDSGDVAILTGSPRDDTFLGVPGKFQLSANNGLSAVRGLHFDRVLAQLPHYSP